VPSAKQPDSQLSRRKKLVPPVDDSRILLRKCVSLFMNVPRLLPHTPA